MSVRSGTGLRRAVRQIATGVTVLTCCDAAGQHGTTVSAVVTVSREPVLIGVCLNRRSEFLRRVRNREWFCVNVLSTGQAPLARWFADPGRPSGAAQFEAAQFEAAQFEAASSEGATWRADPVCGAPALDGGLARLTCRLTGCQPVGDHYLLLAAVVSGQARPGAPLLSFAGALHDGPGEPGEAGRRDGPGGPEEAGRRDGPGGPEEAGRRDGPGEPGEAGRPAAVPGRKGRGCP